MLQSVSVRAVSHRAYCKRNINTTSLCMYVYVCTVHQAPHTIFRGRESDFFVFFWELFWCGKAGKKSNIYRIRWALYFKFTYRFSVSIFWRFYILENILYLLSSWFCLPGFNMNWKYICDDEWFCVEGYLSLYISIFYQWIWMVLNLVCAFFFFAQFANYICVLLLSGEESCCLGWPNKLDVYTLDIFEDFRGFRIWRASGSYEFNSNGIIFLSDINYFC